MGLAQEAAGMAYFELNARPGKREWVGGSFLDITLKQFLFLPFPLGKRSKCHVAAGCLLGGPNLPLLSKSEISTRWSADASSSK